jgi:outer membrane receptor for ferrienterochelin and colicins
MGKVEGNINSRVKINKNWSSMLLVHAEDYRGNIDHNHDKFLDLPKSNQINIMNRWSYDVHEKGHSQFGVRFLTENRTGGHVKEHSDMMNSYNFGIKTNHYEFFAKNGIMFSGKPYRSLGLIVSGSRHEHQSFFGNNIYDANQNNAYANLIYQDILKTTDHKFSGGMSFNFDQYSEILNDSSLLRDEKVPGVFAQYTYSPNDSTSLIVGMRTDYHSEFGLFYTPRLHFRQNLPLNIVLRASAGKGYRVGNIIAENISMLATSKEIIFSEKQKPEIAWNAGINVSKYFKNSNRDVVVVHLDYYRTQFVNQYIADMDKDVGKIYIYNLENNSFSNSGQAELSIYPIERFDITLAYRINDVKMLINNKMQAKPLVSTHKALATISYATKFEKWKFDFTCLLNGKSRLPDTQSNPIEYQLPDYSPAHFILHAQITKKYRNWDFYVGGENLTNFVQENPIIASEDPFGKYFDSSIIWGPIVGRMLYFGFRYGLSNN